MMRTDTPKTIYLKDYKEPAYKVEGIDLTFKIFDDRTLVTAMTTYSKNHEGDEPLVLNGEHQKLLFLRLDGRETEHTLDDTSLTIPAPGNMFTLEIETEIDPASNTRLDGLYMSGGNWCTQCEAEGFRSITYFQDRPDVMTIFNVRIEADKEKCPVLLSNGNLKEEGDLGDGRHFTVWHDPFAKPCYLFALVAGDLVHIKDNFTTKSERDVDLRIYVREGDETQCDHAMKALKDSMKWDEDVYGREYELDRFNIVAVSDFNMGAMENTSLNIFNTALVLAHPDTATDHDFGRVEGVIAHEYFHNWTGNRVTCRDWFQLSLKEGLTVFRDQEFSSDMNSRDVQRIDDVALLRRMQFAEDASPMAHPIRPDNYIEINNFYTVTVYEKGAEVIRMQHTLLGAEYYRKATDLYFERYDGMAVTCDDFVECMADASGQDMEQFKLWYSQAGTPAVKATGTYDESAQTYTLELSQEIPNTPGQDNKKPMIIPVKVGLVGPNGDDMAEDMFILREQSQTFTFDNIASEPVPSILRNFSAPIKLETNLSNDNLRFLMVHDNDGFNRWEAGQTLALRMFNDMLDKYEANESYNACPEFIESFGALIAQAGDQKTDKALLSRALTLPSVAIIGQQRDLVDPAAIHEVRQLTLKAIKDAFADRLQSIHTDNTPTEFKNDFAAQSERSLKNTILGLLDDPAIAAAQYNNALCMNDRVGALSILADHDAAETKQAFADFYERFEDYLLVIDKWFSLQAAAMHDDTFTSLESLKKHSAFTMTNPNRVRSLFGAFAMNNPVCFHAPDGRGYKFLADAIIELNAINPQIAARMLTPFKEWQRYVPALQAQMKAELQRIADTDNLSPNVFEIVTKSLKG